jgi:hypothetical protein
LGSGKVMPVTSLAMLQMFSEVGNQSGIGVGGCSVPVMKSCAASIPRLMN